MKEIVIVGESYFDREFLQFLVKKYCGKNFRFNLQTKYTNKSSILKDFCKFEKWAFNAKKAKLDTNIILSCDLDFDENCVSDFFKKQGVNSKKFPGNFLAIIQIREIESWILADPVGLEKWTKIPKIHFDRCLKNFEITEKSTKTFLNIVSKKIKFKKLLCNTKNSDQKSEYYNEELLDFVTKYFDSERARKNNQSLNRFLEKIENGFLI